MKTGEFSIRQNEVQETQLSLFPIYRRLPKLDVAGSTPVSRSIFNNLQIPPDTSKLLHPPLRTDEAAAWLVLGR